MTKSARTPTRDETGRAMRRLLQALAEPGARGALSPLEASTLVVLAARKGVTVARARFAAAASDAALAEGLVRWEREGGERRLALTDAGRAYLRRLSALDVDQAEPFRAQHASYALRQLEKGARPTLVNDARKVPSPGWRGGRTARAEPFSTPRSSKPASAFAATSNRRSSCSA
ncbi:hypothetical protein [Methylocystis sp. H62]|uniref:hypothetical protein n=1 Tax=Methylocystis sp. H62 TaxID=2785789 RepID=UPI001FEDD75E|nr:hypothetical protein [Methylocystis sp. H62]